jgi:hypothetical protein
MDDFLRFFLSKYFWPLASSLDHETYWESKRERVQMKPSNLHELEDSIGMKTRSDVNYERPQSRPAWPTIKTMNVDCIEYFCSKTSIQCSQLRQAATAMPRPPQNRQTKNSALEKYKTLLLRDLL